jgi:hypothetical protein
MPGHRSPYSETVDWVTDNMFVHLLGRGNFIAEDSMPDIKLFLIWPRNKKYI